MPHLKDSLQNLLNQVERMSITPQQRTLLAHAREVVLATSEDQLQALLGQISPPASIDLEMGEPLLLTQKGKAPMATVREPTLLEKYLKDSLLAALGAIDQHPAKTKLTAGEQQTLEGARQTLKTSSDQATLQTVAPTLRALRVSLQRHPTAPVAAQTPAAPAKFVVMRGGWGGRAKDPPGGA
jgi:hypothetical protein